VTDITRILRH